VPSFTVHDLFIQGSRDIYTCVPFLEASVQIRTNVRTLCW